MNRARLAAIIVGAGIVSSLTDWFFAGDWIHQRYTYPEVWRQGDENRAIALTSPLPFVTCGVFAFVADRLGLASVSSALKLAVAVWVIGPLPLIVTKRGIHEAAPSFRDVLRGRLVSQAHDHCPGSRLVPTLTLRSMRVIDSMTMSAP